MSNSINILDVKAGLEEENQKYVLDVKELLRSHKVKLINLMASPGSGKTSLLIKTIKALKDEYQIGVIEADVDSIEDAKTVKEAGAFPLQVHTGGSCHMDARMTLESLKQMDLDALDIIFLENVGNLVCPAEFDVGADLKVMILSIPEGDDKPLKYPLMFKVSDLLLINKIDTLEVFDFDFDKLRQNVNMHHPNMPIIPISCINSKGINEWINWLKNKLKEDYENN